jgi:hypothetical protein
LQANSQSQLIKEEDMVKQLSLDSTMSEFFWQLKGNVQTNDPPRPAPSASPFCPELESQLAELDLFKGFEFE